MSSGQRDEKSIFTAAMAIKAPAEREAYLDKACGPDPLLRARICALLDAGKGQSDFLAEFAPTPETLVNDLEETLGTMIDRYRILDKIGEGGMAVVYAAEQREPIHRKVALKIIKLGMDTKQVIARFEAERQALAVMDHPNIAKVFDGGATSAGRPYFVMELVKGVSITEYCDMNRLDTRERLLLCLRVCNAVHHAHQKGIIHRDIKPSNVMVTMNDGEAIPKVIDFGIAKATSQRLTEKTLFTHCAQMIGTPEYMSPEQAQMSGLDVDTRTDIYSLGVLLYELLTGATPLGSEELRRAGYGRIQELLRDTEPLRPSTKLNTLGETLRTVAEQRRTDAKALRRAIRGDLDWIVMKCLEKDRSWRYETVHDLVADIERHLRHEAVLAGSPGMAYRLHKFWQRRRHAILAAVAVMVFMAGTSRERGGIPEQSENPVGQGRSSAGDCQSGGAWRLSGGLLPGQESRAIYSCRFIAHCSVAARMQESFYRHDPGGDKHLLQREFDQRPMAVPGTVTSGEHQVPAWCLPLEDREDGV